MAFEEVSEGMLKYDYAKRTRFGLTTRDVTGQPVLHFDASSKVGIMRACPASSWG